MLLRERRPDAEIAGCFPDFGTYRSLIKRTAALFALLGFGVYCVSETGVVTLVFPHGSIEGDPVIGSV